MKLYSTIEVANITGLTRSHLSERCKEFNMKLIKRKYLLTLHQWYNILSKKHRSEFMIAVKRIQPVEFVPIFSGVIKVTETYHIYESKMNFI